MRVLHVINGLGTGGAERSLQEMLPHLRRRGVASEIAVFHLREHGVEERVRHLGTPVHEILTPSRRQRLVALRRLVKQRRPDLVHTSLIEADVAARLAAIGTGVPVATSLVNTSWDPARQADPRLKLHRIAAARGLDAMTALAFGSGFHAISNAVRDDAVQALGLRPDEIRVIPRGRDRARLGARTSARRDRARAELGLDPDHLLVLNVGRQEYQKGQDVLLHAFFALADTRPELRLVIAGRDGNVSSELGRIVDHSPHRARVRFLGHTDAVPDLLCAADVFAFPSRFEGLGGSLLEALALRAPIVASDVPAIRWVLGDGDAGLLVPPDDPSALASALATTLDDHEATRCRVDAGESRFKSAFELESVVDAMVQWFRDTAEGRA